MMGVDPHWLWLIGGVILLIAEVIAPGFFLMFIGAAAIATGLIALLLPIGVAVQLALFAILALTIVRFGGPMRRATITRATLCSTIASAECSAAWSSSFRQSTHMAGGCALAIANGRRAARLLQSAIACGSSMSTAIA